VFTVNLNCEGRSGRWGTSGPMVRTILQFCICSTSRRLNDLVRKLPLPRERSAYFAAGGGTTLNTNDVGVSERTKAALAAKRANGAKLGNPSIVAAGSLGRSVQTAAADEFVAGLMPVVHAIRSTGSTTLEAITQALNQRGIRSARGGKWHVSSVSNLLGRAQKFAAAR
jgi:hypothetical protein